MVSYSIVNYARLIQVNPDTALEKANKKFIRRFQYVEQKTREAEKSLHELTEKELVGYWEQAKAYTQES